MRYNFRISSELQPNLVDSLLKWSEEQSYFQFLDSHENPDSYQSHKWICAIGASKVFQYNDNNPLDELLEFHTQNKDWLFGHLSYDLKNDLESLNSNNADHLDFAKLLFFIPETIVYSEEDHYVVKSLVYNNEHDFISALPKLEAEAHSKTVELIPQTSRSEYLEKIEGLKRHLQYGNIYEINYCIEFSAQDDINPLSVFKQLSAIAKAPFMSYYKCLDQHMACASPERYLKKNGSKLISQPIKGTAKRSQNKTEDEALKKALAEDEKELSENVMIVDLVRNDLSKIATKASVKVEELFGIYSYPSVHQMVSTITCELKPELGFTDAIKASFPMGSMTGAPKYKAMQLIEEFENFSRSLYSGSVGYITPHGDFDLNVVIRSILYNSKSHYVSARVGSAITIHCEAEKEYEECLLKANNLFRALQSEINKV